MRNEKVTSATIEGDTLRSYNARCRGANSSVLQGCVCGVSVEGLVACFGGWMACDRAE